jgi:acetolactate synthase regulatory subunit
MRKPFLGLAVISTLAVVALAATTSVNRVLSGVIGLSTETVDYAGIVHVVTKVPGNSCAPTDPCEVFVNLAGVNGVGRTSGGVYQFVGAANAKLESALPNVVTTLEVRGFRAVPPNPTAPVDPCRVRLELIVDCEGTATVTGAQLVFESCGVDACP